MPDYDVEIINEHKNIKMKRSHIENKHNNPSLSEPKSHYFGAIGICLVFKE